MREISTASIHGEAELFRRMNSVHLGRSKRIHSIRVTGIHVFLILVLVALTGYLAFRLGHFLLSWDRLEVKTFKLVNPPAGNDAELNGILNEHRGNILSLAVQDLQARLRTLPQVQDLSVYRRLPDVVEIRFSLRKPVLQIQNGSGIWYYDREGRRLYQGRELQDDLITCKDIEEKDMMRIGRLIDELAPLRGNLEYVSFRKPYGLVIKLKGYVELFFPGEQDFAFKISRFMNVRTMDALAPFHIKIVDLRFPVRIYIEHETEEVMAP